IAIDSDNYVVAMADPCNNEINESLSEILDAYIQPVLVDLFQLERHINTVYKHEVYAKSLLKKFRQELHTDDSKNEDLDFLRSSDQASAVVLLEEILAEAYHQKASDVHIEYEKNISRVRYRVDGILRTQFETSASIATVLIRRLQILANIDISHHLRSEDGRFSIKIDNKVISMRLSIMPLDTGQSAVIRFLGDVSSSEDLRTIVADPIVCNMMLDYLQRSYGMLLIVGPTGSGKTTTQYSALMSIDREAKKVVSIEDPVEAHLPGVNQIPVNSEIGMDFSDILRGTLRQDPDVIMIGEIRDNNTATMSVRAAITGHMVLATIHTYDVASAISRLLNLGVNPHIMAAALRLVASQRLLRRLCPYCKVPHVVEPGDLAIISDFPELKKKLLGKKAYKKSGCSQCDMTGYLGRLAVFEIIKLDSKLVSYLDRSDISGFNVEIRRKMLGKDLLSNALGKVDNGETSLEEALKVLSE
ncbi:MAG: GspE/PulE family protein, partial [Pseudomonadota bacterium]|nr:GspE/PulE family protein [Pseudomonadota bacterium]